MKYFCGGSEERETMNPIVLFFIYLKKQTFHLNYQHKGGFENYKNLETNLIHLVMDMKRLSGLKNGVKPNSNKNDDLSITEAVTRK